MRRLTPALLAAAVLAAAGIGLRGMDTPASARFLEGDQISQQGELSLYMSLNEDGDPALSFPEGTNSVYAVIDYQNASNDRYQVRFRDMAGVTVHTVETEGLSGSGRHSEQISVTYFVNAYRQHLANQQSALEANASELATRCQDVPEVPMVWPPTDPNPSDPYSNWLKGTLAELESARVASTDMRRTANTMQSMPDIAGSAAISTPLTSVISALAEAETKLGEGRDKLQPPAGRPDPEAGCMNLAEAGDAINASGQASAEALAELPQDVSAWSLPLSSGRYDDEGEFVGCLQYETDIKPIFGGQPSDSAAASVQWAVGDPGPAALIFPSPNEADPGSQGRLNVRYGEGAESMFAQSVQIEGRSLNREAFIGAYVTDEKCIPVDGQTLDFAVAIAPFSPRNPTPTPMAGTPPVPTNPPPPNQVPGSISPSSVTVNGGIAEAVITSGQTRARGLVTASLAISGMVGPMAGGQYTTVGPAWSVEFKGLRSKTVNRCALQERDRQVLLSIFAIDANGNNVADGTEVEFQIVPNPADIVEPLKMAFERKRRGARVWETIEFMPDNKRAVLETLNGSSIIKDQELIYDYNGPLLLSAEDADGARDIQVKVDERTITGEDFRNSCEPSIFLPILVKDHNLIVTQGPRIRTLSADSLKAPATPSAAEIRGR